MLDVCRGPDGPSSARRGEHGTYPIVAWSRGGDVTWGAEAIMLAAGSNVDWLREDLGLIASSDESHDVAASVESADGVVFVPALLGLGTPQWDYGARGTLLGVTRGHDARPRRAGRARGRRPPRRRPRRRGRGRHRPDASSASGSTAG